MLGSSEDRTGSGALARAARRASQPLGCIRCQPNLPQQAHELRVAPSSICARADSIAAGMEVRTVVTPELEQQLLSSGPWMHPYKLDENTIVGYFKGRIEETVCVSSSPEDVRSAMAAAFADYMAADPYFDVRALTGRFPDARSFLDIACATGRFSLALADEGAAEVTGVEIRAEQVAQAELIRGLDQGRFAAVSFEHEPMSADDPGFRIDERFDAVLSMGLLYHLTNPWLHLRNLRRLARQAVLLHTLTHAQERGFWMYVPENTTLITKAWEGLSLIPHHADVPDLLRAAGFRDVEVIRTPAVRHLQAWDDRKPGRLEELILVGIARRGLDRWRSTRYVRIARQSLRVWQNPRYYSYIAS